MKRIMFVLVLLIGLASATFASDRKPTLVDMMVGCDYPTAIVTLSGQVTDGSNPISGATLTLRRASDGMVCEVLTTPTFGYYSFAPVFTDGYIVTASAHGYYQYAHYVALLGDMTLNIILTED